MSGRRAIFLGSKAFGLAILRTLVHAQPDVSWRVMHPDDRGDSRSAIDKFRSYCTERGLDFMLACNVAEANQTITADPPDLVMVCGWYFIIPPTVLGTSRFLGIHNSLLPKYRGGAPLVWAMINGERQVGSSLFDFTPGMDDGPIHLQIKIAVGLESTIGDVLAELESRFLDALPAIWRGIISDESRGMEQDHSSATYCGQRIPQDGLIDWTQPAKKVHDFIRAQTSPYPGAFTRGPAGDIYIWRSRVDPRTHWGVPGQILLRKEHGCLIACGDGTALCVLEASGFNGETRQTTLFPSLATRLGAVSERR